MGFGWEGDLVRLVPLDKGRHLENAYLWMNDPVVTEWLLVGDFPISKLAEEAWFESRMRSTDSDLAMAIELLDGTHIGFTGLHGTDLRHGVAESGSMIGRTDLWGNGYGTDAAKIRLRYAFEVLGLRILKSGCLGGNVASFRMLSKAGYVEYGRLPNAVWKRGEFRDHIYMYVDHERWEEIRNNG